MKPNEPETVTISMQVALEEAVERLTAAETASRNRILFLAQSNANLKARLAEAEAEVEALKASAKTKAN